MDCVAGLVTVCSPCAHVLTGGGWMQGTLVLRCVAGLDGLCGLARPAALVAVCSPPAEDPTQGGWQLRPLALAVFVGWIGC